MAGRHSRCKGRIGREKGRELVCVWKQELPVPGHYCLVLPEALAEGISVKSECSQVSSFQTGAFRGHWEDLMGRRERRMEQA